MTPTDVIYRRAAETVDQIIASLTGPYLVRQIGEAVDRAAREFHWPDGQIRSQSQFLDHVADFLQHLNARAFPHGPQFSPSQARNKAVALLEHAYQGAFATGYAAALADATDPAHGGLTKVLLAVADIVKAREYRLHIRSVVIRHVDPADWHMKCALAGVLLDRCRDQLPPRLRGCMPAQLVDCIEDLLAINIAAKHRAVDWTSESEGPSD